MPAFVLAPSLSPDCRAVASACLASLFMCAVELPQRGCHAPFLALFSFARFNPGQH